MRPKKPDVRPERAAFMPDLRSDRADLRPKRQKRPY